MIITEVWLRAYMTGGLGINSNQLKALGVKDFTKGWLKNLIGEEITEEQARLYEQYSNNTKEQAIEYIKMCSKIKPKIKKEIKKEEVTVEYPIREGFNQIAYISFDDMDRV